MYWTETTKRQNKLQCYVAANIKYTMADYLSPNTYFKMRKTLTRYRQKVQTQQPIAIEKRRNMKTWLPRENEEQDSATVAARYGDGCHGERKSPHQ